MVTIRTCCAKLTVTKTYIAGAIGEISRRAFEGVACAIWAIWSDRANPARYVVGGVRASRSQGAVEALGTRSRDGG